MKTDSLELLAKFEKFNRAMDKDCPRHDCDRYNSALRGGCVLGTKRVNCWAFIPKEQSSKVKE